MSGHSKWSTIKHKKGAADAKRGKLFTKLIKEITVAARMGGCEIDSNPRLRVAVNAGKSANMPSDNITRAIKKGTGELEGIQYEEMTYEGYGQGGAAVFIEIMTDNKNRTVSEVRSIFSKNGGNMGANGCVAWMFEQKGFILVSAENNEEDELLELVLEAGADDLKREEDKFEVYTSLDNFEPVRKVLEDKGIAMEVAELTRIPQNTVNVTNEKEGKALLRMMDSLEDHDDVQKAYSNFDISEELLETLVG
jgi:YebC/PmpR family DNA-binding regulatory protein